MGEQLSETYPCNGGAFFWVANDDVNGEWSKPMQAQLALDSGNCSDREEEPDTPVVTPTNAPVVDPTNAPVVDPTTAPVPNPTNAPVVDPTAAPTTLPPVPPNPTSAPIVPDENNNNG